jgi:hypothetical protein
MEEYVAMMKNLEKKMISTGKDLEEKEIVSYILFGLRDVYYDSLIAVILARTEPITVSALYSQLESYESCQQRIRRRSQSSINASTCGGRGRFGGRGRGNPGGHNGGYGGQGVYPNGG